MASLRKNTAGQKIRMAAMLNGALYSGDAANITGKISRDRGTFVPLASPTPTETLAGVYEWDLTLAEVTDVDVLDFGGSSTTSGVTIVPVLNVFLDPADLATQLSKIGTADGDSDAAKAAQQTLKKLDSALTQA